MVAAQRLLFLPVVAAASWDDSQALLQKSADKSGLPKSLEELADIAKLGPRPEVGDLSAQRAAVEGLGPVKQADQDRISKGWETFFNKASKDTEATPEELLGQARAALLQTGAMETMRSMAQTAANRTRTKRGAVPMDSMIVGFTSSIAPWANLLRAFHAPLVKVKFELFANFFGPGGDAGRICIASSVALDSHYATFDDAEFGGVTFFAGPAKWDNVPGWAFGSSGGFDDAKTLDASDFGWKWTFAHQPQTVMFYWDLMLLDSKGLQTRPVLLQTESKTASGGPRHPLLQYPTHSSTFFGHTWCSPDWANTPMVLEAPLDVAAEVPTVAPSTYIGVPFTVAPPLSEADAI